MKASIAVTRVSATALIAILLPAVPSGSAIAAPASFEVVKGSWTGGGALNFKDGRHETLSCTAYYTSASGGSALTTALRCSGPSGKFELRSRLSYAGGKVNGKFTLDTAFDGVKNTKANGIIHVVAGGGGASLYGPGLDKTAETLKAAHGANYGEYTAKMVADEHSFVVLDMSPERLQMTAFGAKGNELDRIAMTK